MSNKYRWRAVIDLAKAIVVETTVIIFIKQRFG